MSWRAPPGHPLRGVGELRPRGGPVTDPALECSLEVAPRDPLAAVTFMAWLSGWDEDRKLAELRRLAPFGFPQERKNATGYSPYGLPLVPLWVSWVAHACVEARVDLTDVFGAAPLSKIRDAAIALGHDAWARNPKQFLALLRRMLGDGGKLAMAAARLGGPDAAAAILTPGWVDAQGKPT